VPGFNPATVYIGVSKTAALKGGTTLGETGFAARPEVRHKTSTMYRAPTTPPRKITGLKWLPAAGRQAGGHYKKQD
jgi:hypothetical protein